MRRQSLRKCSLLLSVLAITTMTAPLGAATVVVKPGDTLSDIARQELGDGKLWPQLCELNRAILANCDTLPVGATITTAPGEVPGVPPAAPAPAAEPGTPASSEVAPLLVPSEVAEPAEDARQPALNDEGQSVASRANLVAAPSDFAASYWTPYFVKPGTSAGRDDPQGGQNATEMSPADDEGAGYSGVVHSEALPPGTYTVGLWLRSVEGMQSFRYGISDTHLAPGLASVGQDWQYFQAVIEVEAETNRLFQVYEFAKNNPAWEIYGVSVERGEFDTPFYPAP